MKLQGLLLVSGLSLALLGFTAAIHPHSMIVNQNRVWRYNIPAGRSPAAPPQLLAQSAFLADAITGKELYSLNPDIERPPASTTKIITCTLAIEAGKLDRSVVCSKLAAGAEPSNIVMKPGEKIPLRDLLYAMMIHSANDAAVAVAEAVAGSVPKFAVRMNALAKRLGCTHTHFVTPNGLQDPYHYTTSRDMAAFTVYALKHRFFNQLIRTRTYRIHRSINQKNVVMHRSRGDHFLVTYPGADGVKTGFTHPAGRCYVGAATHPDSYGGWRLVTVVFHTKDTYRDSSALMDYGFSAWARHRLIDSYAPQGQVLPGPASPRGPLVRVVALSPLMVILPAGRPHVVEYRYHVHVEAPAHAHQVVGYLDASVDGARPERRTLVLDAEVPAPASWRGAQAARWLLGLAALLALGLSYGSYSKTNRRRRAMLPTLRRGVDRGGPGYGERPNGQYRRDGGPSR